MPPPTSKAWNYFKRTADSNTVKCKLCETELTYTGGTTNMLNHLRLKHNTGIEHENTPQKQPSMAEFVRSPSSRHLSGAGTPLFGCTRHISAIREILLDSWTYPNETTQ